jgi:hypothetical protein
MGFDGIKGWGVFVGAVMEVGRGRGVDSASLGQGREPESVRPHGCKQSVHVGRFAGVVGRSRGGRGEAEIVGQ